MGIFPKESFSEFIVSIFSPFSSYSVSSIIFDIMGQNGQMSCLERLSQINLILRVDRSYHIQIGLNPLSLLVVFCVSFYISCISHLIYLMSPSFGRLLIFIRSSVPYRHIFGLCAIELDLFIWNAWSSWHMVILLESSTIGAQIIGNLVEIFAKFRWNLLFSIIRDWILNRRIFKFFWLVFDTLSETLIEETQSVKVIFVYRRNSLTMTIIIFVVHLFFIITSRSLVVLFYRFSWRQI